MNPSDDRTPPNRVRLTKLQEAQLPNLLDVDAACAAMYHEIGFDSAEVPLRTEADFAALPREHDVHVAEADHVPAGFLAWRDEAPGVAYLADVSVHPEYQRFGIATKLFEAMRDEARAAKLPVIVARCWEKASWAMGFYRRLGFRPLGADAPARVRAWAEERAAAGRPLTRPGEVVLWVEAGQAPVVADDEDAADDEAGA